MKKLIISTVMALGLAVSAFAGGTNSNSYYSGNEFTLSLGSGYAVNQVKPFTQPYSVNLDAGAQYFFTKYFGVEGNVPFYSTKGTSVSEVRLGFLARLPIGRLAPYVGLGGDYNWSGDTFENVTRSKFSYIGKAGLEFRLFKPVGVFAEYDYENNHVNVLTGGQSSVRGGLHLTF
jgi:hypothetical protein